MQRWILQIILLKITRLEIPKEKLYSSGVAKIEIERASDRIKIIVHTAKPGL